MKIKQSVSLLYNVIIFIGLMHSSALQSNQKSILDQYIAENVLDKCPYLSDQEFVITENEWHELQLDLLVKKLDQTKTNFGRWGLKKLLWPVADVQKIICRQQIIHQLSQDDRALHHIQQYLGRMQIAHTAVLSYWDEQDKLHEHVQSLLYSHVPFKKTLNHSRIALECSMWFEWNRSLFDLGKTLCLDGLLQELLFWTYGNNDSLDLLRGLKRGLSEPIRNNNPLTQLIKDGYKPTHKEFTRILVNGTMGDRCKIFAQGYNQKTIVNLPFLAPQEIESKVFFSDNTFVPQSVKFFISSFGIAAALGYSVWYDMRLYRRGQDVIGHLRFLLKTINQLHERLSFVAAFINNARELNEYLDKNHLMQDTDCKKQLEYFFDTNQVSKKIDALLKTLNSSTFKTSSKLFYSRGKLLFAHQQLCEIKDELVPLLQAVALCDAYASIAALYKSDQTKFCFVKFIENKTPIISLQNCWTPLVGSNNTVGNSFDLGQVTYPTKLILTGPNGCGKSTFLKAFGQAVVMAESWGIVSAQTAQMTLVHDLKTCLASTEDVQNGLSTFMAEDKRMQEIHAFITTNPKSNIAMVLIDEPWRGTVDDASAQYIYEFGQDIAPLNNVIACIATHVKKPINLAKETNDIFGNAHVKIIPKDDGTFIRTFEIQPGPATWWFEDSEQRGKFIQWLKVLYTVTH